MHCWRDISLGGLLIIDPLKIGPMLDPSLLLVVNDLLETKISNSFLVLVNLLFILEIEQPVLRDNDVTVHVDAILVVILRGLVLHSQVLSGVLVQPCVVVVVLLLQESFFNDDCEDIRNHTHRDKDVAVKVDLRNQRVNLDHVVVGVKDHIPVHQSEQCVATD